MRVLLVFISLLVLLPGGYVEIKKDDRCAVCGMQPYKHPEWKAEILLKDGRYIPFDSPKCMFKYYLNFKGRTEIEAIYVTEYYRLKPIDARRAYFVVGSDVYGPMGNDLVPLRSREEAEEFLKDHNGKRILKFEDVDKRLIEGIESGKW